MARRLRLPDIGVEVLLAAFGAAVTALVAFAGVHKLGMAGALLPLGLVLAAIVISRPVLAVSGVVALMILCEGSTFGIANFTSKIYSTVYGDIGLPDVLVALAVLSVGLDVMRHRRPLWVPRPLTPALLLLGLAMIAGVVVGHGAGASLKFAVFSEHVLAYLIVLPLAIANLDIDRTQLRRLLGGLMVIALIKAVLGLIEVFGHLGASIEGTSTLTYYEPAANWVVMVAILTIFAATLARAKPPLWMLLGTPLTITCLVLSYRRSFWIGALLGLLLVLLLGTTPTARRMLVPAGLAIVFAVWVLGTVSFQSQIPVVKRFESLSPNKLEQNVEDRYRLDERTNVLGNIGENPITGLGVTIPWKATFQPLSIEHEAGREYVHFAALWFWLKLGILGLAAYVSIILGGALLSWQAWRRGSDPLLRAFGLGSVCAMAGLVAIDTTASFTGVDGRFTIVLAAQFGLLALIVRLADAPGGAVSQTAA